eukprot:40977-Alexandrium_andersonii.AAC.1
MKPNGAASTTVNTTPCTTTVLARKGGDIIGGTCKGPTAAFVSMHFAPVRQCTDGHSQGGNPPPWQP